MGFDSLFFFGWMDSTSVGPLVHDVPLRWPQVSPRVVVRRFHHERDDPPPAKVPGGRAVESAQARQASPAGAPMLPFPSPLYEELPQELPNTSPQRQSGTPPSPLYVPAFTSSP